MSVYSAAKTGDEGQHLLAPVVEEAVLGQRPIEEVEQVTDLVRIVLQADGQSARTWTLLGSRTNSKPENA